MDVNLWSTLFLEDPLNNDKYLLGASIDLRTFLTSLAIWTLASPVMEAESAMLSSISEAITPGATTGSLSSLNMSHLSYIKAGSVEMLNTNERSPKGAMVHSLMKIHIKWRSCLLLVTLSYLWLPLFAFGYLWLQTLHSHNELILVWSLIFIYYLQFFYTTLDGASFHFSNAIFCHFLKWQSSFILYQW